MPTGPMPAIEVVEILKRGVVIPAHPLALTPKRQLDERHQRALTRYYCAAGAGGVAVGVHTTQFEIRDKEHALLEPVLELARETMDECAEAQGRRIIKVAGICGRTEQAVREASFAMGEGYDIGLLSLSAMRDAGGDELLDHCRAVAEAIPIFGFYLQPSVGGRILPFSFWRRFAELDNVVAIKMAPFNRYQTIDVVRAVAEAGRAQDVVLYTGNDDNIIADLLTPYHFQVNGECVEVRIVGGLLGHWACWTKKAVEQLKSIHQVIESGEPIGREWLTLNAEVTDANAAFFDPAHGFAGCIAGIHEVLVRQGLTQGRRCLNPKEDLSPGQKEEIDRVYQAYPHLNDDEFVAEHLDQWLK